MPKETHLFYLRYKDGLRGIKIGCIEATSLDRATRMGRQWCAEHAGTLFLEVYDPILASENGEMVVGIEDVSKLEFVNAGQSKARPEVSGNRA